ncbi:MAG: hypothetical protein JWP35_626 [Caulobacter sp.]|nr:hypothetical protein [Caulobacter sp.]
MTLTLSQDRTVNVGETVSFTDTTGFYLYDPYGDQHPNLTNRGTITLTSNATGGTQVAGYVMGVKDGSNVYLTPSLFSNEAGATLKVNATGVTVAYGFWSGGGSGTNVSNAARSICRSRPRTGPWR